VTREHRFTIRLAEQELAAIKGFADDRRVITSVAMRMLIERPEEADVIDILSLGREGCVLAAVVPISAIAIRIDHHKPMLVSQAVELIAGT